MADYKFNINHLLDQIDQKNYALYGEIIEDDDLKKEIDKSLAFVIPVWMSGAINDAQHRTAIERFDEYCNTGWFTLNKHPHLQMLRLCAAATGKAVRHKPFFTGARKEYSKIIDVFRRVYPDIRKEDIKLWVHKYTIDDFTDLLTRLGEQEKDIKDLIKEFSSYKKEIA